MTNAYFLLWIKIIDLSETAIYLLRKKNNQVSVLHLYHHISTCLVGFIFGRYFTSEVSLLFPILNSGVHVIMYFYYFLSNFDGPIKQMINPFKRYLTLLQMVNENFQNYFDNKTFINSLPIKYLKIFSQYLKIFCQ